jgi:hypothetical protein
LVRGNYNKSAYDRTAWFAFSGSEFEQIDLAESPNENGESAHSDIDIKRDIKQIHTSAPPSFPTPEVQQPPIGKPKGEPMLTGFDDFWAAWPRSDRKGGKADCLALWKKGKLQIDLNQILSHVEHMKSTTDWKKNDGEFIPAPKVYLHQRRWDGAEMGVEAEGQNWWDRGV